MVKEKQYFKEWAEKNREHLRIYRAKWRKKRRSHITKYDRLWRAKKRSGEKETSQTK